MAHLKGQNVNLLIDGKVIAASSSCDFSITANTTDGAAKDDANPMWDNPAFTYYDWSASNESFIIGTTDLNALLTKMVTGDCTVQLQWQCGSSAGISGLCKKGTAVITSLEIDAPSDDYAKLSLSFEGASALESGTFTTITPVTEARDKMRGKALMLAIYDDQNETWHTICSATSHKLSLSAQTSDTKTKDDNDKAISKEVTGKSMTVSTENLINISEASSTACERAAGLLSYATNGTSIQIALGYYDTAVGHAVGTTGDWGQGSALISGEFICSSWSTSGANKEDATMSAEFTLQGAPTIA